MIGEKRIMENLRNEIQSFMQEMVENNLDTLKEQNAEYARCKKGATIALNF